MSTATWSHAEKRIARRVFEAALQRELADLMAEFKRRAAAAQEPDDIWSVQEFLATARRDVDSKYDYRYSQLEIAFGRLLREGRIEERDLQGLAEDRLAFIRRVALL
jgi:hypothetical protein